MPGPVLSHRQRFDESNARSVTNLVSALQAIKAAKDDAEAKRRAGVQDQLTALQIQQGQQSVASNQLTLDKQKQDTGMVSAFNDQIDREMNPAAAGPAMPGQPSPFDVAPFTDKGIKSKGDDFKYSIIAKRRTLNGKESTPDQVRQEYEAASAQNTEALATAAAQPGIREMERRKGEATIKQIEANAASGRYSPIPLEGGGIGRFNTKTGVVEETGSRGVPKAGSNPDNLLPLDVKKQIEGLATKNASKIAIANQMDSYLHEFQTAADDDTKARIGGQMLKVLNSPEGSDAIGVEEAKRLGDALEYNIFDVKAGLGIKAGKMHGRDLKGFETQVQATIDAVRGATRQNKTEIDKLYGRTPAAAAPVSSKFKILSVE